MLGLSEELLESKNGEQLARRGIHDARATAPLLAWAAQLGDAEIPTPRGALGDLDPVSSAAEEVAYELLQRRQVSIPTGGARSGGSALMAGFARSKQSTIVATTNQEAASSSAESPSGDFAADRTIVDSTIPGAGVTSVDAPSSAASSRGEEHDPIVGPPVHRMCDRLAAERMLSAVGHPHYQQPIIATAVAPTMHLNRRGRTLGSARERTYHSIGLVSESFSHEEIRLVDYINAKAGYVAARATLSAASSTMEVASSDASSSSGTSAVGVGQAAEDAAARLLEGGRVSVISASEALTTRSISTVIRAASAAGATVGTSFAGEVELAIAPGIAPSTK